MLKGGKIIGAYKLHGKSCHVMGKLESCDLRLEGSSKIEIDKLTISKILFVLIELGMDNFLFCLDVCRT